MSSAELPPEGLPGLDPQWSRLIETPDLDGHDRTWHVLDNQIEDPRLTLLCIHGNPTWSYLWRDVIAQAPAGVRVIAVDQLNMGYSDRTGTFRRFDQRINDLSALTDALGLVGPIVTVAHDWGGAISLGWAERHVDQLAGVVLTNTAVHQPAASRAPTLIRLIRVRGLLHAICQWTPAFIWGTLTLARPRLTKPVRRAYHAPYRGSRRRRAIAHFVKDIPLSDRHPTQILLDKVAADLTLLADIPTLLLWGPSDPVFSDLYLRDLTTRLPHADVHRFVGAGHMVVEDADVAGAVYRWIERLDAEPALPGRPDVGREPLWAALDRRADDTEIAITEMVGEGPGESVTFAELAADVRRVAAGLVDLGVVPGDRVAILVPPGIDLAVCIYACWRMGAVVVIADAGLGVRGMGRALKGADPRYLIGIPKALAVARAARWPGIRVSSAEMSGIRSRLLKVAETLAGLRRRGRDASAPSEPGPLDDAAILFTSGSTGPAKGVAYSHHQLQAQRDAIVDLYGLTSADRLVAAFGPFALFGPGIGITSVVPDMEVTSPGTLTAQALADAVAAVDATLVFGSPAALKNVSATASDLSPRQHLALQGVRLVMSAGAPVPSAILSDITAIMPNAESHTPYGMTEVLPVADISFTEIRRAGEGFGVCVGQTVPGVDAAISPLDSAGEATGGLTTEPGVVGEVCVKADHIRDGYDGLWLTEAAATMPGGWHRTGDVGHLDHEGRLWIEGRLAHLIRTALGPVTPIGIEHAVAELPTVALAAAIGVGPPGSQQVVVVAVPVDGVKRPELAGEEFAARIRATIAVDVAAVFAVPSLPVDKRHNSKIDRTRVAAWAEPILAGGRVGRL